MQCKCGESGVYNEILGKGFYYCRNCKDEVRLETVESFNASTSEPEPAGWSHSCGGHSYFFPAWAESCADCGAKNPYKANLGEWSHVCINSHTYSLPDGFDCFSCGAKKQSQTVTCTTTQILAPKSQACQHKSRSKHVFRVGQGEKCDDCGDRLWN